MTYVSWSALYEGATDQQYFDNLIPRLMEDILRTRGTRHTTVPPLPAILFKRGDAQSIGQQICDGGDAYELAFIHADTGGRALEAAMAGRSCDICDAAHAICGWLLDRCIIIAPRHELEAWALCDSQAVCDSLGYGGTPQSIGLPLTPAQAERLIDPKATLEAAISAVRRSRRPIPSSQLLPTIAQRQDLNELRKLNHFRMFEDHVIAALRSLGCV